MITGTCHFVSRESAMSYYAAYGFSRADVTEKLKRREIAIGEPQLKPGQTLRRIDDGQRYAIEERTRS